MLQNTESCEGISARVSNQHNKSIYQSQESDLIQYLITISK